MTRASAYIIRCTEYGAKMSPFRRHLVKAPRHFSLFFFSYTRAPLLVRARLLVLEIPLFFFFSTRRDKWGQAYGVLGVPGGQGVPRRAPPAHFRLEEDSSFFLFIFPCLSPWHWAHHGTGLTTVDWSEGRVEALARAAQQIQWALFDKAHDFDVHTSACPLFKLLTGVDPESRSGKRWGHETAGDRLLGRLLMFAARQTSH